MISIFAAPFFKMCGMESANVWSEAALSFNLIVLVLQQHNYIFKDINRVLMFRVGMFQSHLQGVYSGKDPPSSALG